MIHAECCPADKFRGSCAATQVQRLAFVTRLLAGCPSLESEERILWTHPVNLSVGFRIPGSEQKRVRTPSLARKLLHGGRTKVASPTSQIPEIHKTWGLLTQLSTESSNTTTEAHREMDQDPAPEVAMCHEFLRNSIILQTSESPWVCVLWFILVDVTAWSRRLFQDEWKAQMGWLMWTVHSRSFFYFYFLVFLPIFYSLAYLLKEAWKEKRLVGKSYQVIMTRPGGKSSGANRFRV